MLGGMLGPSRCNNQSTVTPPAVATSPGTAVAAGVAGTTAAGATGSAAAAVAAGAAFTGVATATGVTPAPMPCAAAPEAASSASKTTAAFVITVCRRVRLLIPAQARPEDLPPSHQRACGASYAVTCDCKSIAGQPPVTLTPRHASQPPMTWGSTSKTGIAPTWRVLHGLAVCRVPQPAADLA
jgi:hypothetical protein